MKKLVLIISFVLTMFTLGNTTNVQAAGTRTVGASTMDNKYGIKIDGKFSDWNEIPKTDVKNNWPSDPTKQEALVADDDYVYYYLTMSKDKKRGGTVPGSEYQLKIGPKNHVIYLVGIGDIQNNQVNDIVLKDTTGKGGDVILKNTSAKIYRYSKGGLTYDEMEWKIPLSDLGVTTNTQQKISIKVPALGNKVVETVGGSTGPVLLASVGLVIAVFGVIKISRVKKLKGDI